MEHVLSPMNRVLLKAAIKSKSRLSAETLLALYDQIGDPALLAAYEAKAEVEQVLVKEEAA